MHAITSPDVQMYVMRQLAASDWLTYVKTTRYSRGIRATVMTHEKSYGEMY